MVYYVLLYCMLLYVKIYIYMHTHICVCVLLYMVCNMLYYVVVACQMGGFGLFRRAAMPHAPPPTDAQIETNVCTI